MPALSHAYFYKDSQVGYADGATQSVSVTTQSPRNALSSLGYKGVVGYIKQPNTADVSVEEFVPASVGIWVAANAAAGASSNPAKATKKLSDIATDDDAAGAGAGWTIAGAVNCVLTGVTFNFNAGQPARVTWNYLGRGGVAELDGGSTYSPAAGTGVEKTVLLWENINLTNDTLYPTGGTEFISHPASGIQSVTFSGTINKDTLYALGTAGVYQHVTTFPTNVTVSMESYERLTSVVTASGNIAVGPVKAITCYQTQRGQNVAVGGFRTCTEQYTAADLEWYSI